MEPTAIDPQVLAAAQQIVMANWGGVTQKTVSSTPRSGGYAHGPFGLMSAPGMSRDVINAMMLPHLGLQSVLPSYPSVDEFPLYGIVTGQTASTGTFNGTNAQGVCGTAPNAGLLKLCSQSYKFGRQSIQTEVAELDRFGRRNNRAEYDDYRLIGGPYEANPAMVPSVPNAAGGIQAALNNEVAKMFFELAVAWTRDYAPFLYIGNRTNNTGGGIIKEYNGLDALINTGYRDADTGTACARADSIVRSFSSRNVKTSPAAADGIVTTITGIDRQLRFRAVEMGLTPVELVLAMRWSAFYELTEVWPCAYSTYRCLTGTGLSDSQPAVNDALKLQEMRNEMRGDWDARTGQFLWIDGIRRRVIIDDAIPETALSAGAFNSTIYWVPLTVRGGFRSTYFEYLPYNTPGGALEAARALAPGDSYFVTDDGRFLWHKRPPENFCVQVVVKSEPRLILRTPQLAARLANVAYTPWQHEDDWSTASNVYYHLNGGKTGWIAPSFFPPNTTTG